MTLVQPSADVARGAMAIEPTAVRLPQRRRHLGIPADQPADASLGTGWPGPRALPGLASAHGVQHLSSLSGSPFNAVNDSACRKGAVAVDLPVSAQPSISLSRRE